MFGHDVIIKYEGEEGDDGGNPVIQEKVRWSQQETESAADSVFHDG